MRRRDFIAVLGGAAAARPLAARAQQSPSVVRHVGVLMTAFSNVEAARSLLDPFRQGLRELGWIEGQNVSIEYRFANGRGLGLVLIALVVVVNATAWGLRRAGERFRGDPCARLSQICRSCSKT